jgi:TIR domain
MDIDAVPVGSDFDAAISRAMASCDVFIALIGRRWLQATDADGRRRLDDPDDYVRREIESALTQGVVVVPTCVQGAEIPHPEDLPPSLVALTRRQGFHLSDAGWQDDARRLLRRLESVEREPSEGPVAAAGPARARRRRRPGVRTLTLGALGCVALAGVLAAVLFGGGGGGGGESSTPPASQTTPQPSGVSRARGTVTLGSDLRSPAGSDRWYSEGTSLERWSPPLGPERRPSDSGGAQTYELLYNAIVERDRDGDGYGDVIQDRCPRDPRRHAGC